ncbi:hypothetical protein RRG08_047416 [Elysia crispata]|uniref:Uncharacterized protein n=1 Tax=Elysia crispata TaxID=231223 RepID=A0AAE0YUN2_9GAST|nr:hypothetical protein RRG08_047416 [Elysia crispata]
MSLSRDGPSWACLTSPSAPGCPFLFDCACRNCCPLCPPAHSQDEDMPMLPRARPPHFFMTVRIVSCDADTLCLTNPYKYRKASVGDSTAIDTSRDHRIETVEPLELG